MRRRLSGLLACLVFAAAGCGASHDPPRRAGAGCEHLDRSTTCSVLFIGNSYTFANDLPAVFKRLARSGGHPVTTGELATGGATLANHVSAPETAATLRGSTWNVVALQEQSQIPSLPALSANDMFPAARTLVQQVRAVGAQPLFFVTWAHRDGWPENGVNGYVAMQNAVDDSYLSIARELHVPVAPVGIAWSQALVDPAPPDLWVGDGSHPTMSGTYLAACVFYATVFHTSPVGISYRAGLSVDTAAQLQTVAAMQVLGNPET